MKTKKQLEADLLKLRTVIADLVFHEKPILLNGERTSIRRHDLAAVAKAWDETT